MGNKHQAQSTAIGRTPLQGSLESQLVLAEATQCILQRQAEILEVLVTAYVSSC